MNLKKSSVKCHPFCLVFIVLTKPILMHHQLGWQEHVAMEILSRLFTFGHIVYPVQFQSMLSLVYNTVTKAQYA